jgi:hypothetical protein
MDLQQALSILGRVGAGESLSLSELTQARDTIARQLHSLRGSATPDLDALTTLRESYFAAAAAVEAAEEAEQASAQEINDALSDIPDPDASEDEADDDEDEEEDPEAESEKSLSSKPKRGKMLSIQEAVARLGLDTTHTTVTEPERDLSTTQTRVILNGTEVQSASIYNLAEAFRDASSRSLKAGKERVARIETSFAEERTLTGKINADTRLVDSFMSPEAVTAAGGCCSLPQPIYTNPVYGSTARPIRDSLPTMGATRGKFTFFNAICLPVDGFGIWTCADDEAVLEADPDTWKTCADVDCDDTDEVGVDAIYSCVTVGNYQTRFAPEQWQGYLSALAIMNARQAELALYTKMRAQVITTHTLAALGSTFANLVNGVSLAAAAMRQDQRLSELQLNLWLPDWIRTAIRLDLVNRRVFSSAVDDPNVTDGLIAAALSNEGVNVVYSPDINPIQTAPATNGPLTAFPTTANGVLAPEGFFSFLDGGTLDLGTEIRDHNLNRQNKVAAFAESYEGLLARGCDARGINVPVQICTNVSCPV